MSGIGWKWIATGLGAAVLAALALYLKRHDPSSPAARFPPCLIQASTGFYCSGCGSTRAAHALVNFDLGDAWRKNAAFVLAAPGIVLGGCVLWLRWIYPERPTPFDRFLKYLPHALPLWILGILFLYAILRNLPGEPFALLAPR